MVDEATAPETYPDVLAVVADITLATMREGQMKKHLPGIWQTESTDHHVQHAITHLLDYVRYGHTVDLEHGLTRLAMASWTDRHRK